MNPEPTLEDIAARLAKGLSHAQGCDYQMCEWTRYFGCGGCEDANKALTDYEKYVSAHIPEAEDEDETNEDLR